MSASDDTSPPKINNSSLLYTAAASTELARQLHEAKITWVELIRRLQAIWSESSFAKMADFGLWLVQTPSYPLTAREFMLTERAEDGCHEWLTRPVTQKRGVPWCWDANGNPREYTTAKVTMPPDDIWDKFFEAFRGALPTQVTLLGIGYDMSRFEFSKSGPPYVRSINLPSESPRSWHIQCEAGAGVGFWWPMSSVNEKGECTPMNGTPMCHSDSFRL